MNQQNTLITVVVPIYNVEAYLKKCVDSLLNQDFDSYKIILVDDCSTDSSASIAQKYSEDNPRIVTFYQRDKNGGLSAARNSGMRLANSEWITFVDSDDWVDDCYLSLLYKTACVFRADVVMGNVGYVYDSGELKNAIPYGNLKNGADKREIIATCRSYAWGRLFKKSLFDERNFFFPEDIKRSEDICTIIPVLTYANHIALQDRVLYYYYQRSNSISNSNKNIDLSFYPKTLDRMLKLASPGFEEELEFRAIHEMLYGMVYLMIQSKKNKNEFCRHIDWFNKEFPNWQKNKYLKSLSRLKQLFVKLAGDKRYSILKMLVVIRNLKSNAFG